MFGVYGFGPRNVAVRVVGTPTVVVGSEHIGICAAARIFKDHSVGVQQVVAVAPLQEDVQIPVLIDEVVGEPACMLGLSVADDGAVVVGDFVRTVIMKFFVLGVTGLHVVGDSGYSVFQFVRNGTVGIGRLVEVVVLVSAFVDEAVYFPADSPTRLMYAGILL